MTRACRLCGILLDHTNESKEHIILNCIGGRLTSEDLWCRACNSTLGYNCDAELCRQMLPLANLLNIKRDRGTTPDLTIEGEDGLLFGLRPNGQSYLSSIAVTTADGTVQIPAQTRNLEKLHRTLVGLKRKCPDVDVEGTLRRARASTAYIKVAEGLPFSVGGHLMFQSVARSALAFYLRQGGDPTWISDVLRYLREGNDDAPVWFLDPVPDVVPPQDGQTLHTLVVRGDPEERCLYAFVELFSVYKFLVRLNMRYTGTLFFEWYTFDVMRREQLTDSAPTLRLHRAEIEEIFRQAIMPVERIRLDLARALEIAYKPRSPIGVMSAAVDRWFDRQIPGADFNEERIGELADVVAKSLLPFIARSSAKRQREEE